MKISPARKAAFEILCRIETEKAYSSALLPHFEDKLGEKDSALCHELTLGVIRRKLYLDRVFEVLTKKQLSKFDQEVLVALRVGLYQLFFLDKIPAYSAINESVNLVKAARKRSASGLVNAVLRRASKEKPSIEYSDELEKLAIETSHPKWLLQKWIEQIGFEETSKIANANNQIPPKTFRVTKKFEESPELFKKDFFEYLNSEESGVRGFELVKNCFVAEGITEKIQQFLNLGLIYFQDPASQMVADSIVLDEGATFLDICASPGSKATRIATTNKNVRLIAGDLHDGRIRYLRDNISKQCANDIEIIQYDAEVSLPFKEGSFDIVLVDAPCSGTGTIRHNPEIRYSLVENDLAALSSKQLSILKNASKLIRIGGKIVYSTCSIEPEENEAVIEKFLAENARFSKEEKPGFDDRFLTSDGFSRTISHRDNMDGFFVAVLRREA